MTDSKSIKVHHLTRVEGHGDIVAEIEGGRLKEVRFPIVEAPRFFEVFLRGQMYGEVVHMASRICGICAVSHRCCALKATEQALAVEISPQTLLLRRLAFHGEVMSSHLLHIYFLAAPDFFNVPSIFHLAESDPDLVRRAMRMKKLAYDQCAAVVGRHTHPVAMTVGGFTFVHSESELAALKSRLAGAVDDLRATMEVFRSISIPDFERQTGYVSLKHPEHYAFYEGDVFSSEGELVEPDRYQEIIKEHVVPYSTAKHARWHGSPYMVGALARVNNNYEQLSPLAREAADTLGLKAPCFNPFMNTLAQVVEYAHCLEESMEIIDTLLARGITAGEELARVEPRAGLGVGAVEAPRGLLFHEYDYDARGKCIGANLVIPTAQNLANIEADMQAFVPGIIRDSREAITRKLEMLVRAYDPCISCSTHVLIKR